MRIGIDIDDTTTNTWECFIPYYHEVFKIPIETLKLSKPYYEAVKDKLSLDEYFNVILPIYNEQTPLVTLKENVKEVIDELYMLGHKVFFITARGKETKDIYNVTKKYLDNYQIKYEKLIIDASDKARFCVEEKIDLFIDDSFKHCDAISKLGIDVLMFETAYNKEYKQFRRVKSWKEIYEYIKSR